MKECRGFGQLRRDTETHLVLLGVLHQLSAVVTSDDTGLDESAPVSRRFLVLLSKEQDIRGRQRGLLFRPWTCWANLFFLKLWVIVNVTILLVLLAAKCHGYSLCTR